MSDKNVSPHNADNTDTDVTGLAFAATLVRFQSMSDGTVRIILDTGEQDRAAILDACNWMIQGGLRVAIVPDTD